MKRQVFVVIVLVLASSVALAQSGPNDVGQPAVNGPSLGPGAAPERALACPPAGVVQTAFSGSNTQDGRVFRDGVPSTCPGKAYPGFFNAGTNYHYETFTYDNTSGATACVTVNFDPNAGTNPCGTNAHASAYIGSYDPANQAANFVGDVGSSVTQPFSFDVPGGQSMVLVVTNTASAAVCDFAFQVVDLPCIEGGVNDVALTKTVSPAAVNVGQNAVFTLTATNILINGTGAAVNTVVTDTLPSGLIYVSNTCGATFSAPTLTWNIGTLMSGTSVSCNVTVNVNAGGTLTNNAGIEADGQDPVLANNFARASVRGVSGIPTLSIAGTLVLISLLAAAALWVLRSRG